MSPTYTRDRDTARNVAGVYLNPRHPLSTSVHAFHHWTGDRILATWCGVPVDLTEGGAQTTDTINCLACAEASFQSEQSWIRQIRWYQ